MKVTMKPGLLSHVLGVGTAAIIGAGTGLSEESILPHGDAPAAIVSHHFPDRAHEFVWRNWDAVEPAKLATIIGASEEDVTSLAESMGLSAKANVPSEMRERGYVSLIRRNWHLLPYEQLLELLDITPERLAAMLREEDFLWIKLGRLKPACEPLRYQAPDDATRFRASEIRRVVEEEFGEATRRPGEPRFHFVQQFRKPLSSYNPPRKEKVRVPVQRIVYSYVAVYGDPLWNPNLDPYPDGLLERLSASGINGVWLQAVLRDLAPGGTAFPEFGFGHEQRLANLRALVNRAQAFGINVYLYINEPRAMPAAFFSGRPETAGVREGDLVAMCTSNPTVRDWIGEALAHVFREVPGLGGIYAITASENLTNCASHGDWHSCPRCKERSDAEILAETVAVLEKGVHLGNPEANVLISDWGWRGHGDATEIIPRLPESVWLMSVSEWNLPIERGGIKSAVGEYSISAVGPGPRSQSHWRVARNHGLRIGTEIQFNNTCEIASIPYLPVLDLIAEHCRNLQPIGLDAMLIGWTMGGYPSPNFQLAAQMSRTPVPDLRAALDDLALERFGPEGAPHARKAWSLMSEAFREYPFHISVVYLSPVQWGAANPLYPEKTGYRATMWGLPYDDLEGWRGPYPPEVFAEQFEKIAEGWGPGIAELQAAVDHAPLERGNEAMADLRYARAAAIHFQSVANQARFVRLRDTLAEPSPTLAPEDRQNALAEIKRILESEINLARQLFTLVQEDSRIGFEPSCQYFYLPLDLVEKVVNCRWLLEHASGETSENGHGSANTPHHPISAPG